MVATIEFTDTNMREAYIGGLRLIGYKEGTVLGHGESGTYVVNGTTVSVNFAKPLTAQPSAQKTASYVWLPINSTLVNGYNDIKDNFNVEGDSPENLAWIVKKLFGLVE